MEPDPEKPEPPRCEDCEGEPLPNGRKCFECRDDALRRCGAKARWFSNQVASGESGKAYVPGVGGATWNDLADYIAAHE